MIITLITIGVLILGVVLLIIGIKFNFNGSEIVAGSGVLLLAVSGLAGIVIGWHIIDSQLPLTRYNLQLDYEEKYNTLVTSLKADKNNVMVLADKIAEYNIEVREHYARLEDPWINWLEPTVDIELKTINLEDYLN